MLNTTPVRAKSAPAQSTPQARGTASHTSFGEEHTQDHYAPYLAEDLKRKVVINLDAFCERAFPTSLDRYRIVLDQIAQQTDLQDLLNAFCQPVDRETHRYYPFTKLVNAAVSNLKHKLGAKIELNDLVFCRNDPVYIVGSYAHRKPDVVGVANGAIAGNLDRISVDNLSDKGPSEMAFAWHELLLFVEFKLVKPSIERSAQGRIQPGV